MLLMANVIYGFGGFLHRRKAGKHLPGRGDYSWLHVLFAEEGLRVGCGVGKF